MSDEKQDHERPESASDQDEDTNTIDNSELGAPRIPPPAIPRADWQRGLLETTRALDSLGGIGTVQRQIQEAMRSIAGIGTLDRLGTWQKDMQASMKAITGIGNLDMLGAWQRDMQASMRAINGVNALEGIGAWQRDFQTSMRAISGTGIPSNIGAIQTMLAASPLQSVLDLHAKTWLAYPNALTSFDTLYRQIPHLETLTRSLQGYNFRIEHQVEAFQQVTYLQAYQKRSLIAHESRQQKVRLGPADLDNAEIIVQGIDSTQALIDGIAKVDDDAEQVLSPAFEAELFDALAKEGEEYPIPLRGAIQTASSDNPDRARQTIASLRELTSHLLRKLSPDDEVRKWSSKPEHYVDKRPTRACRLEYIFRDCTGSTIRPYIDNEVKFAKDFFDLLNKGTHSLETQLTESDLRYAIYKTESFILLLLKYARR
jgi:hypothetical protein